MDDIKITSGNFQEYKDKILKIIQDLTFEDLDPKYEMNMMNGILMGNHANQCDDCNVLHYLMSLVIDAHRLRIGR